MQFYSILTNIGMAQIANAVALGQTVSWREMAVGDGNGNPTTPSQTQTGLVRERYRAQINQMSVDPDNPNYIIAELVVPTNVGGWTVHEVGIYDDAVPANLVAVANFPATYKPQLVEGSGRDLYVRIIIEVSNASVVQLKIDPSIVLANRKWVADNFVQKVKVAGGTTGQVLAKSSNADEAFKWVDPTAAVNVIVDARPERQTLAADQTVVTLATLTTPALAVYIEGVRLIETIDYTATSNTTITLARSYPAGSRIHMYQNDPTSQIADASETQRGFARVATQSEVDAGAVDNKMVSPKKLRMGFSHLFAANGFVKLPSWLGGLVVQWGSATIPVGGGTIVFPFRFPSACYATVATDGGSATHAIGITATTEANFSATANRVTDGGPTSAGFYWISFGR